MWVYINMQLPLEGIMVVETTIWELGPVATTMLADLGAEVIHIEDRVSGDPSRGVMSIMGSTMDKHSEQNFVFETHNRNKKGIVLHH
jgi:crotonobetainyl-CoA:carnitine CoA-transferase CaiB-like acyl-CoA transferase